MTDREMLELAARAAEWQLCGYSWISESEDDEEFEILESAFVKHHQEQGLATRWNPLTDDGDALRLAARLNMDIEIDEFFVIAYCPSELGCIRIELEIKEEKMKTARLVITMAAAKAGKEMK